MPDDAPIARHRALTLSIIAALILVLGGYLLWEHRDSAYVQQFLGTHTGSSTSTPQGAKLIATATYTCDNGKTITASYYDTSGGEPAPAVLPGQMPPPPPGSVSLTLSDGRTMTLPQTISGSGIRYANGDETFIFWSKGTTAFIEEGPSQTETYQNCVSTDQVPGAQASTSAPEEGVMPSDSSMPDSGVLQ